MGIKISRYTVKLVKEDTHIYEVDNKRVGSPRDVQNLLNTVYDLENSAVEKFGIICLNTKGFVSGMHIISQGTLNASLVHPREIFQAALLHSVNSIIVFHNHPSGDTEPSGEDIALTCRLVEAGGILGIKVMDHIIIGSGSYKSFKESGYIG